MKIQKKIVQGKQTIADSLKKIYTSVEYVYAGGGFTVNLILMDQESANIVVRMDMAIVNTCATNEHETDVERNICTIKGSTCCSVAEFWQIRIHTLPK